MTDEWHGMANDQIDANLDKVPPRPSGEGAAVAVLDGGPRYHRVRFSGNYGLLCSSFQAFDRAGIMEEEANQIAWAAFGLCGHTVEYYDANGCRAK